ncbi:hypothetical protein OG588_22255 [Streptomyces prunicolor]|uniref:hypothetical protein n=1 Tax=Streptomyces prunicolor TaxID=67348 RepID=UPI00386D2B90|nr:hypothetical protein OG588_22255 [Streptomyces prunicolor]
MPAERDPGPGHRIGATIIVGSTGPADGGKATTVSKLAQPVVWNPEFFGIRPHLLLKSGQIAWVRTSDGKASVPARQPDVPWPVFGVQGRVPAVGSLNFVTRATRDDVAPELPPTRRALAHVRSSPCSAALNSARKEFTVLRCAELPMLQHCFMF